MRRFLCFKSCCTKADRKESEDSPVGRLALRDAPRVPDYFAVSSRRTELWCNEMTAPVSEDTPPKSRRIASHYLQRPETFPRTRVPGIDDTITSHTCKGVEKRKSPGADLPAEKKARTVASAYSAPVTESESD